MTGDNFVLSFASLITIVMVMAGTTASLGNLSVIV